MDREEKIGRIIDIFKNGEKNKEDLSIGMEIEHFIVDKKDYSPIGYYGKNGVGEILKEISEKLPVIDVIEWEGNILGLILEDYEISIEPGSQFEISLNKNKDIARLEEIYVKALEDIKEILDSFGYTLIAIGYRPNSTIDQIKMIPRPRYERMRNFFSADGLGHNMMLQTASVQVSIDYIDEEDFKKKYLLANALSPILYAVFDSIHIFEKEVMEDKRNKRAEIWYNTSADRTGIYEGLNKDFGFYQYAEKILDTRQIFDPYTLEELMDETLEDLLDKDLSDEDIDEYIDEYIKHGLTIVFPDVRLKNFIEIRMMDSLPIKYSFSILALIKGIFYSDNLDKLYEEFKTIDDKAIRGGIIGIINNGLESYYWSDYIINWANKLVNMAKESLSVDERKYLVPMENLLSNMDSPKDLFERTYEEKGLMEAYRLFEA